jgi:hypothetical protein
MFDFAVVIPTVLRPELLRAARSVVQQDVDGAINLLIGVDYPLGDRAVLDRVAKLGRRGRRVTIIEPGYSTARQRGGFYPNRHGGSLRTALSYMANARYVAYLDDDNWHAPNHLETLAKALQGKAWAFSLRYYCDSRTGVPLAIDTIESVGPKRDAQVATLGAFCSSSTLMLDSAATYDAWPAWSRGATQDGRAADRSILVALKDRPHGETGLATAYYSMQHADINHEGRLKWLHSIGVRPSLPTSFEQATELLGSTVEAASTPLKPMRKLPKAHGPAIFADLLRQAKARRVIVVGAADVALIRFVFETLKPVGVTPHVLQIDNDEAASEPERRAAFLGALAATPYRDRVTLSSEPIAELTAFLREREVLADFAYVGPTAGSLDDVLTALWMTVKCDGVLLGANYDATRRPALVRAADEFAYRRAAVLVRCGTGAAQHFCIRRV